MSNDNEGSFGNIKGQNLVDDCPSIVGNSTACGYVKTISWKDDSNNILDCFEDLSEVFKVYVFEFINDVEKISVYFSTFLMHRVMLLTGVSTPIA